VPDDPAPRGPDEEGFWTDADREHSSFGEKIFSSDVDRDRAGDRSDWGRAADGAVYIGDALGEAGAVAVAIGVVAVALVLAWFFVFPVLILVVDLLLFVIIAIGGVAVRVLFRRPFKVEARAVDPPPETHTFGVVGIRASGQAVDTVADAIQRGMPANEIRLGGRYGNQ
jgi:hypothetical protein